MSTRNRLARITLSLVLAAPAAGFAQNRRSPAARSVEDSDREDAPRSSPARTRGRAQNDEESEAPPARRTARITRAPARTEPARPRAAEPRARASDPEREDDSEPEEREQPASASPIRGLASEGPRAASFVPRGWVLEQQAEGDLTGDRRPDLAILIRQQRPDDAEHDRALVVVERGADGVYARIGVGTRFLLCSSCYGSVAGTVGAPLLSIRRRELHVGQLSGNREARERSLRFRLDAESGRLHLVGEELHAWDRVDHRGTRTVTHHLARTRTIERYASDERRGRETRTIETQQAVDVGERLSLEECE